MSLPHPVPRQLLSTLSLVSSISLMNMLICPSLSSVSWHITAWLLTVLDGSLQPFLLWSPVYSFQVPSASFLFIVFTVIASKCCLIMSQVWGQVHFLSLATFLFSVFLKAIIAWFSFHSFIWVYIWLSLYPPIALWNTSLDFFPCDPIAVSTSPCWNHSSGALCPAHLNWLLPRPAAQLLSWDRPLPSS